MINTTATSLCVTTDGDAGCNYDPPDLYFDLDRFPALTQLGVEVEVRSCMSMQCCSRAGCPNLHVNCCVPLWEERSIVAHEINLNLGDWSIEPMQV